MAFTPISKVYLLDTPLDNKYKNQILFRSASAQYNYFMSQLKHTFDGVTYQRKDNIIRVNENIDDLWDSNYVMYQNTNFSSKWFYAFITKMEYVNASVTDIYIETDVFQTWLFECTLKPSFVIREHTSSDDLGEHLVDEQLETGEYVVDGYYKMDKLGDSWNILAVSDNSIFETTASNGNMYGNVVSGLTYYPFPNTAAGIEWLKFAIQMYTEAGKIDAIVMIFTAPLMVISSTLNETNWEGGYPVPSGSDFGTAQFTEPKQVSTIDGYTPKNKKMFNFPYKFLYVTNNNGLSATYRYENFPSNDMDFELFGSLMPNPTIMLSPNNYKALGFNMEEGLTLNGFPLCSWTTDTYAAWLAQNGPGAAIAMVGAGVALTAGIMTANPLAITGGALSVASQLAQLYQASIQPDQAKGHAGSGSLMVGHYTLDFYYGHMSIRAEFAKRIDDYFTMFGYKVNTLKVPETKSRINWNYIQTIDVNIDGAIPVEDMRRLKAMYDEGVTLWHTPANFLNYGLNNTIGDLYVPVPTLTSATTNSAGTIITLTFSENMINPVGKQSQFTVKVNGVNRSISSIALNGTNKYNLTLGLSVVGEDVVTVSYTKGTIKSSDNGVLENFNNIAVTNVAPLHPNFVSATTDTSGSLVTVTFTKTMNDPAGKQSEFNLTANGTTVTIVSITLNADPHKIDIHLEVPVSYNQSLLLDYTRGTFTDSLDNLLLFNLVDKPITNAVPQPPSYQQWANYPQSPVLSTEYPYQLIHYFTGDKPNYTFLLVSPDVLRMNDIYIEGNAAGTALMARYKYDYGRGVWDLFSTTTSLNLTGQTKQEANHNVYTNDTLTTIAFAKTTP